MTVHAVFGMYHAENILKLFGLYIVIKSKSHIVYKVRGYHQNKIKEIASRWFYTIYHDARSI